MIKEDCEVSFGAYAGGSGNVDDNETYIDLLFIQNISPFLIG